MRPQARWCFPLALLVVPAACMYDPNPPDGKQKCAPPTASRRCPDGYVCVSNYCYSAERAPSGPGTGGISGGGGGNGGGKAGGGNTGFGGSGRGGTGGSIPGFGGLIPGFGGVTSGGGTIPGLGGVAGGGGSTSTGGIIVPPNTGTVVTFADGMAHGAMTGPGWVVPAPLARISSPTCKQPPGSITSTTVCDETLWSRSDALCMSGLLPAVPALPTLADWDANWGMEIGVGATPEDVGTLGKPFYSIRLAVTGTPLAGLRAQVHVQGDPEKVNYCALMSPGLSIPFSYFNTACWDDTGIDLSPAKVAKVDKVMLMVPSGFTSVLVADLCLTGITFAM